MRTVLVVLMLASVCARADSRDETGPLLAEIEALKKEYAQQQASLQKVTAERWSARQEQVSVKESNKEELDDVRQEMERLYADVARAREELLARENAVADELEKLRLKQEEWGFVEQAVSDKVEKAGDQVAAGFPIGREARMGRIASIGMALGGRQGPAARLEPLIMARVEELREGSRIGLARRTFVVGSNEPVTAQVLRIGHCMAYGLGPDGQAYFLGGTGRVGPHAFTWRTMTDPDASAVVAKAIPDVLERTVLQASLPVDILQNRYSDALLSGESRDWLVQAKEFARAGGPVLIPLAIVVLWALFIVFSRLVTFATRHRRGYRFINEAVALLEQGKREEAATFASGGKGVLARILSECLKHAQWSRGSAEQAVSELLLAEAPELDRHLDTLAVLAGAAPLLGLLGTVTGMIEMFEAITRFGTGDPKLLAGGISEALITTEVGLAIAIPTLLLHNFLRNRRNRIQADMEMYAMRILNRLWPEE